MTSILLPIYNGEKYIVETIESILLQEGDWELIIQDDCSTDTTSILVEKYLNKKIKYFKNEKSLKCFGTLNAAVSNSTGELLRLFSHDDIMLENDILISEQYMNNNTDVGLCFTNYDMIDEIGQITSSSFEFYKRNIELPSKMKGQQAAWLLYKWGCISGTQSNITMRRDVYNAIGGFNSSMLYVGDFYLLATVGVQFGIGYCLDKTCQIRFHAEQTSKQGQKSQLKNGEMKIVLDVLLEAMSHKINSLAKSKFAQWYGYQMINNPLKSIYRFQFISMIEFVKLFGFKNFILSFFYMVKNVFVKPKHM